MYQKTILLRINNIQQNLKLLFKKYRGISLLVMFLLALLTTYFIFLSIKDKVIDETKINTQIVTNQTVQVSPSTSDENIIYPSQILNLSNWKVTLPFGYSKSPNEVRQPQLSKYKIDPWFIAYPDGDFVIFRAAVNGVTTSGSDYPRSELREMSNNGKTNASWASNNGEHSMFLDQSITNLPKTKQQIVAGQIHDGKKDIIVIRLDYPNLHIRVDGKNVYTLETNYKLGDRFTVSFVVKNDQTKVYYNNSIEPVYQLNKNYSNSYFKAGAYTQSNCEKEKLPLLCNNDNYGEVRIYKVEVTHE